MKRLHWIAAACCASVLVIGISVRAEGAWKMPALPGFGSKEPAPPKPVPYRARTPSSDSTSHYRAAPKRSSSGMSAIKKFNDDTKEFFVKAGGALNPWKKAPQPPAARRPFNPYRAAAEAKKPKTNWFFSSWFRPAKKKPKRPMTTSEWIGQPRPGF